MRIHQSSRECAAASVPPHLHLPGRAACRLRAVLPGLVGLAPVVLRAEATPPTVRGQQHRASVLFLVHFQDPRPARKGVGPSVTSQPPLRPGGALPTCGTAPPARWFSLRRGPGRSTGIVSVPTEFFKQLSIPLWGPPDCVQYPWTCHGCRTGGAPPYQPLRPCKAVPSLPLLSPPMHPHARSCPHPYPAHRPH